MIMFSSFRIEKWLKLFILRKRLQTKLYIKYTVYISIFLKPFFLEHCLLELSRNFWVQHELYKYFCVYSQPACTPNLWSILHKYLFKISIIMLVVHVYCYYTLDYVQKDLRPVGQFVEKMANLRPVGQFFSSSYVQ